MIELDGSHGEGGGSILRQALALSIYSGKEFKITGIRKSRNNPGLAPQHLAAVNAAKNLCDAEVTGSELGSLELSFKPGEFKGGNHKIDIGTAGSITLLFQSLLLPSLFSGKKVSFDIIGGTDVNWSMPFDYFNSVFLPQMRRYGEVEAQLFRRGYYPKGGGEIKLSVKGKYAKEELAIPSIIVVNQKRLLSIKGRSHASAELEPSSVAERQKESAELALNNLKTPINIATEYSKSLSIGSGIVLSAIFGDDETDIMNPIILGADSLGERGKKANSVGLEAAEGLIKVIDSGAAVDHHLADQLIPFLGVSGGAIKTDKITEHTRSNIYVTELFLGVKFDIKENIITCERTSS